LNNQALALAGAGRHEDALAIYPTAIQSRAVLEKEAARDDAGAQQGVLQLWSVLPPSAGWMGSRCGLVARDYGQRTVSGCLVAVELAEIATGIE
jgi:hypothetical protein